MKKADIYTIIERLEEIEDPRRSWGNKRHLLVDILFITLCAIASGMSEIDEIIIFAKERKEWLKKYISLKGGIPSYSTFERVYRMLTPKAMRIFYESWVMAIRPEGENKQVCIDGKSIRGAGAAQKINMVSAWMHEEGLCLGQLRTDKKSNEITAIPELLEMLDISHCVVSIDAIGCQTEISEKIVAKNGDYVLAVKENQPTLMDDIKEYFNWIDREKPRNIVCDHWIGGFEKNHGRIEQRKVSVCTSLDFPEMTSRWKNLRSIVRYECSREIKQVKTVCTRYYISSLNVSAEVMASYLRGHWSIENQLHWLLDVALKEDASLIRTDHAPENFNVLRKVVLNLLRNTPTDKKTSIKGKMLRASMNTDFLELVLFG